MDSLGRFKANGVRFYLFGSIFNLPDKVNIKKYHFPSRGHSFSSITSTLFDIEQWFWHYRVSLVNADRLIYFFTPKITILKNWILTSGHLRSRSRIDLNRSCCIEFDAPWRYEHFGTYLMSLSHSNQKLCLKRNVYWLYDVIIWLGPDTSSATICKKNQAFPDRKNEANRMVYVIKVHSCAKFVVFLHVWFGVTKSMVSLDRFLLRSGYLTSTDVLHVFVNGINSWHRKDSSGIIFMTLAKWVQMKFEGQLSP